MEGRREGDGATPHQTKILPTPLSTTVTKICKQLLEMAVNGWTPREKSFELTPVVIDLRVQAI